MTEEEKRLVGYWTRMGAIYDIKEENVLPLCYLLSDLEIVFSKEISHREKYKRLFFFHEKTEKICYSTVFVFMTRVAIFLSRSNQYDKGYCESFKVSPTTEQDINKIISTIDAKTAFDYYIKSVENLNPSLRASDLYMGVSVECEFISLEAELYANDLIRDFQNKSFS